MQDSDEDALLVTSPVKRDPLSDFQPERRTFFVFTVEEGTEPILPVDWTTTDVPVDVCPAPPPVRRRPAMVDQLSRWWGISKEFLSSGVRRLDPRRPFVSGSRFAALLVYQQLSRLRRLSSQFWRSAVRRLDFGLWLRRCVSGSRFAAIRAYQQLPRLRGLTNQFQQFGARRLDLEPWLPFVGGSLFGAILVYLIISGPSSVRPPRLNSTSAPVSAGSGSSPSTVVPKQSAVAASIVQPVVPASTDLQRRRVVSARPVTSNPSSQAGGVSKPVARLEAVRFRGSMTIASTPPAARVFVNGRHVGVTPLELRELPVGSRAVRVEADGYAPWSSAVRVVANQRTNVTVKLAPMLGDSAP